MISHIHLVPTLTHVRQEYEEVTVPPANVVPSRRDERLIPVTELDALAKGSFPVRNISACIKPVI